MREYKNKNKYYTFDYSEVEKFCHIYISDDTESITDEAEVETWKAEWDKLKRMMQRYCIKGTRIKKYYVPSEYVKELNMLRDGVIDSNNRYYNHTISSIVKDEETDEKINILYNDHDIRFSCESAEDRFFHNESELENAKKDNELSIALYRAWLNVLTPQERFIIYCSSKKINRKKFLTYEEIGYFCNKTGNAVSQNIKTINKKLLKSINATLAEYPKMDISPREKTVCSILS